jgi:long-chain acyl-CoA synthetase
VNFTGRVAQIASGTPDYPAIIMGERTLTYAETLASVATVAGGLRALGVARGDRVLIFSENSPEYLVANLATARLGAILATASATFRSAELEFILGNASPRCVIVQEDLAPVVRAAVGAPGRSGPPLVMSGPGGLSGLPDAPPVEGDEPVAASTGALISYTSGTTTQPKPVFHSHGSLGGIVTSYAALWDLRPEDRVLVGLPMAWLFGLVTTAQTALTAGSTVVLLDHFNPVRALEAIDARGVTVMPGVATMYVKLLEALPGVERRAGRPLESRLRLCVAGGEPPSENAFGRFRARFGVPVFDVYAASECTPICSYEAASDREPRPGSCGRLAAGVEARIVDAEGGDVAPGEAGELLVRGRGQMLGYYHDPELTGAAVQDGWYRTKDLFRVDEDGFYHLVGRASDLIIRGGANVSPLEVEAVLERHAAVVECAVVGLPDASYGEEVCAVVVGPAAGEGEALAAHCREHLAAFKVPTRFEFVAELPRGATGKVLRKALVEHLTASTSTKV